MGALRAAAVMSATAASGGSSAAGPLRPWAGGFAEWLSAQGFTPETIVGYLRWLGWLSDWLAGQGLAAGALTEARAGRFAAVLRAAEARFLSRGGVVADRLRRPRHSLPGAVRHCALPRACPPRRRSPGSGSAGSRHIGCRRRRRAREIPAHAGCGTLDSGPEPARGPPG